MKIHISPKKYEIRSVFRVFLEPLIVDDVWFKVKDML